MSLTVDQLLAAESSSDEDDTPQVAGKSSVQDGSRQEGSAVPHRSAPTLEEALALAQADLSEDEDEDDDFGMQPSRGLDGTSRDGQKAEEAKDAARDAGAAVKSADDTFSDASQEEQEETEVAAAGRMVGLDELLAMGSDSSGDERPGNAAAPNKTVPATSSTSAVSSKKQAEQKNSSAGIGPQDAASKPLQKDEYEEFLQAPFNWCLEHERSLLLTGNGCMLSSSSSEKTAVPAASSATSEAPALPKLVEAKTCTELRRLLAQELGLPTCVTAGRLVGVGTLRGSLVLLDPKLQDVPPKPQVLSPSASEEASAVTAAAFSLDGGSLLVGHKSGQLVLWDLAANKVACSTRDVHHSSVVSVSFCRPSWQYALSADAKGSVYFLTFTNTFGRRDCSRQLLLEQSSNIGVTLRILPVPQVVPGQSTHPADTHCLVALCAANATVLLTLHPGAQVLQKMQYNAKDASWVPDAAWLRPEPKESWADPDQVEAADPQLCVAYGQTIHLMRVAYLMDEAKGKEDFKVSLIGRFTWTSPIRGIAAFSDSVLAVLDGSNKLNVLQFPVPSESTQPGASGAQQLVAVHSEDVTSWSLVYHTSTFLDGRDARSHHAALAVFRGRSRTLYVCGMKEVWSVQIGRWGQHIESLVSRNEWPAALNVFLALRQGLLPPLLDFPHASGPRQKAVESRTTQVIQSYLVNALRTDMNRAEVRQICATAVNVCVEAKLWPVLYKTVFECFKATGHMNVYCNVLEPFIVQGRIPRHEMDSEVLSSILQSYALPLEEEEQAAQQAVKDGGQSYLFVDCDHCPSLFPVARRLQQLVLFVDVSRLDLNLALRLFTQYRLWTALVHVYCALGDYVSPLELLVGECGQLAKKCTATAELSVPSEAPLLKCLLVRKLFFFLHRFFELRAFPLEAKDSPGMLQPSPAAITDLLRCIFKPSGEQGNRQRAPPMFTRLLRLSPRGLFSVLSCIFTSPGTSRAVQDQAAAGKNPLGQEPLEALNTLFRAIESALDASKQEAAEEGPPLPENSDSEFLWFIARSLPKAKSKLPSSQIMQVVDHLLASPTVQGRNRRPAEEAEQLLIGVLLAAQDSLEKLQWNAVIDKASGHGFWGLASWLYERQGEYGKALDCRLQDSDLREAVFEYIISKLSDDPTCSTALVEATLQRLSVLVGVDADRCSLMICEQFTNVANHSSVLERLKQYPQIEMRYLEVLLVRRRLTVQVEDRQAFFNANVVRYIDLLCQNSPGAVLPFILENEALPLRECLELCRRYSVTDASMHLLERTGDFAAVLELLLTDYRVAIEKLHVLFCGQGGDRTALSRAAKRLAALGQVEHPGNLRVPNEVPWWEPHDEPRVL
eukprot:TRINITY_DN36548_c0_g1_i2.p1 TRINITY_DN36548_c0_g1~~TRINITY_DN36548_c0_g1_i2.p1  ORF type:complete len:1349 (-),score=326.86 TRINITY_DN36548_c0_g1_i2:814-4860(-)